MENFLKNVLTDLNKKYTHFDDIIFILPSKRAGLFLKQELSTFLSQPIFSPRILSIEEFVEDLSGLRKLSNIELLFRFYSIYNTLTPKSEIDNFEQFSKWAQILIQDFNEIDRYLIPQDKIFEYLNAIKELQHWSLGQNQTDLIKAHLKFWNRLKDYYAAFRDDLLQSQQGYQGLIYREAVEHIESYVNSSTGTIHVFLGFNALNNAESRIIQELLANDLADIYWDIDKIFFDDTIHDAGLFMRQYQKEWYFYKNNPFKWISENYSTAKHIHIVGIPKLIGQAKYIGQLLEKISQTKTNLSDVAVILGEENLLLPLLNSIPRNISKLNVTMGLPLKYVPLASLFELLFSVHKNKPTSFYYKDVVRLLSHASIHSLFQTTNVNVATDLIKHIQDNNIVYIHINELEAASGPHKGLITLLFSDWCDDTSIALNHCINLIFEIKTNLDKNKQSNTLDLEYLHRFYRLFNQLMDYHQSYQNIDSIGVLNSLYHDVLSSETLDFQGEPLHGLQIMGMLESRSLDFETVIISSVNEGILPSGKTHNSFIPYDVKLENKLPTYKEKDAVYTYHFYRLLQRAKNIYILYNTEIDTLKGGEKSRFITQLEIEGIHALKQNIATPNVPLLKNELKRIQKTALVLDKLKALSEKGFSPSSLTNYIRNPMDFYVEKVLGIKQFEDVEESVAANTLGSVIHNTLEDFYKPFEGALLTQDALKNLKPKIHTTVQKHFKELYKKGDFTKGKNLIIFEIAKRYISNFLDLEIKSLKEGHTIKIIAVEIEECVTVPIESLNFPVYLRGKVDRIDEFNGMTRVIDYKTGKIESGKVEIVDWALLNSDYEKYSKSFQVLCYVYMMHKKSLINLPVEAGIISFKNLSEGFLKFAKKESLYSRKKQHLIENETITHFEKELKQLILDICNPAIDFIEKDLNS